MESNDTKKSEPSTTRHMVTYKMIPERGIFAEGEFKTTEVIGDLAQWHRKMGSDHKFKCIIDFAILLW